MAAKKMRYRIMASDGVAVPWSKGVPTTSVAHLASDPSCWTVKDTQTGRTFTIGKKCSALAGARTKRRSAAKKRRK